MQQQSSLKAGLRRVPVVLAAVMLALLVPVSAASAHDSLIGTNPAGDQTVERVPGGVKLKFSNAPLAMGSQVIVEDSAGKDWAVGDVEIVDNVVTQPISPKAPSGEYKVTWRVVSSDSHPIEGTFTFTAAAGGNGAGSSTTAEQDSASSGSDEAEASNGFPAGLVVGMAAVLIVLVIIIAMIARRRLNHNGPD